MRTRASVFLGSLAVVFTLLSRAEPTADSAVPQANSAVGPRVVEEPFEGGTRFRATTPEVAILSEGKRTVGFRLECLHATARKELPDQCIVYLVSRSPKRRYKDWHLPFTAVVDGATAIDSEFKWFKAVPEGKGVVEPLLSFWSWNEVLAVSGGRYVAFTLDGEKIPFSKEAAAEVNAMVRYFDKSGV